MIVVTGGSGFIGSAVIWKLNSEGITDIVIVDNLGISQKWKNLVNVKYEDYIHKSDFMRMVQEDTVPFEVSCIIHMGACSSTTEQDADYLMENNYRYSRVLAEWAFKRDIRFIYASSAATYGNGLLGFSDDDLLSVKLKPINMYGYSKQIFDLWVLKNRFEEKVAGLKFFNVFGPNEYHKGDMRSVIHKSFWQIREMGKVNLFKSYKPEYAHGEQRRDFVYVKDCVEIIWWLFQHSDVTGIFNIGTGHARTWNDLIKAVFSAMNKSPAIEYIEMPESIQNQYQYFTEARIDKLRATGCPVQFHPLEEAIEDYVSHFLEDQESYLGS